MGLPGACCHMCYMSTVSGTTAPNCTRLTSHPAFSHAVLLQGPGGQGCLLELTWAGSKPLQLSSSIEARKPAAQGQQCPQQQQQRTYLEDGDEVVMRGWCQGEGFRVGFGECRGRLLPAL